MGLIGVFLPFILGTIIGALSGYFGRFVDVVLMRVLDVMLSFPWLVLLIAIITVLRPGLGSFFIAITLVGWVSYARLVRAQTLVLKNSEFVQAAVNLGYGHLRILFRHILPNAMVPSIVFSMKACRQKSLWCGPPNCCARWIFRIRQCVCGLFPMSFPGGCANA